MQKGYPILLMIALTTFFSCKTSVKTDIKGGDSTATVTAAHPAYIMQGNIYEVNIRQYSKEGTFKAFEANL